MKRLHRRLLIVAAGISGIVLVAVTVFRIETHTALRGACYAAAQSGGASLICRLSAPARDDALRRAIYDSNVSAASAILTAGADPSSNGNHALWANVTPLAIAVSQGDIAMAEFLLRRGADPNRLCEEGLPLAAAISRGDERMALLLLERGADPRGHTSKGRSDIYPTPIEAARETGNHRVEELLLRRLGVDAP